MATLDTIGFKLLASDVVAPDEECISVGGLGKGGGCVVHFRKGNGDTNCGSCCRESCRSNLCFCFCDICKGAQADGVICGKCVDTKHTDSDVCVVSPQMGFKKRLSREASGQSAGDVVHDQTTIQQDVVVSSIITKVKDCCSSNVQTSTPGGCCLASVRAKSRAPSGICCTRCGDKLTNPLPVSSVLGKNRLKSHPKSRDNQNRYCDQRLPPRKRLREKSLHLGIQQVTCPTVTPWLLKFVILFGLPVLLQGVANDILRLNIPKEPNLDPNTVCKSYPDLNAPQYDLCFQFPDVTASAIQGVQVAIHECQYQLRQHRWNCSSLEKKNKNPHSSAILRKGFRETAFAYAISSAGVTHQVSKACSLGKLQSCGCDVSVYGKTRDWEWGGCSHNLQFGERFAKKFLDLKEKAHDIHAKINLHNNKVGRMAVIENVRTKCKCHGMSGSCELKTCWKAAPDFREVGELLKAKFNMANRQIDISNEASVDSHLAEEEDVISYPANLLYYEKSPNFCEKNQEYDSLGTVGRLCNKTSKGLDNCETLCCGRGYNTLRVKRTERCHCKFHWCCYVICQTCTYNEWVTVCK